MKRRILVLFLAVICIAALLSSCGEDCVHTDADRNHVCDSCSMPVVTIIEYTAAEEEAVETVIKPMPANVKFSDYILPETLTVMKGTAALADKVTTTTPNQSGVYLISYTDEIADETDPENVVYTYTDTVKAFDSYTGNELYSFTTKPYSLSDTDRDRVSISFKNGAIAYAVSKSIFDAETQSYTNTFTYYTLAGDKIGEVDTDSKQLERAGQIGDLIYVAFDGKTFAIDLESNKIIHSAESSAFVKRPSFIYEDEKYGVVRISSTIYVFDLTTWLNCVYSYELPSYYAQTNVFYLADGKVLVQGVRNAANDTVNYDMLKNGVKTCIDYIMVDPATKTATEIEFGYYIRSARALNEDECALANAKNIFNISRIVNKELASKTEEIVVDADLNILLNAEANLPIFASDVEYVAPGLYLAEIVYGDSSRVDAIYNANGEQVCVLPSEYTQYGSLILVDNVLYTWDMQKKLDLQESGYSIWTAYGEGVILNKTNEETTYTEQFFFTASSEAPVLVVNNSSTTMERYSNIGLVISETVAVSETENKTTYKLYNSAMECVFTTETEIESYYGVDENLFKVTLEDGSVYFIR